MRRPDRPGSPDAGADDAPGRPLFIGTLALPTGDEMVGETVARGARLVADGADIVDVPLTGPGDSRGGRDHQSHMLSVVQALADRGIVVSANTCSADSALVAAERGARYINDDSGGTADIFMARVAAASGLTFIAGSRDRRKGVLPRLDARAQAIRRIGELHEAGIPPERLVLDWSLGDPERSERDWRVLEQLEHIGSLGYRQVVTAANGSLLSSLLPDDANAEQREAATLAVSVLAVSAGVWAVRVRNVARTHRVLRGFPPLGQSARQPSASHDVEAVQS